MHIRRRRVSVMLHLSAVIYNLFPGCTCVHKIHTYVYRNSGRGVETFRAASDGRTGRAYQACASRSNSRGAHTTSDKIPELHFVWNCNFAGFTYGPFLSVPPSFLFLPFSSSSRCLSTLDRARGMLHELHHLNMRADGRIAARAGDGDVYVYVAFVPGKTTNCHRYEAHL